MIEYEIILPKTLFQLYDRSTVSPGDNVHQTWADVVMKEGGRLCIEENSITYSAHSIGHNTGRLTIPKAISFEQLPELIKQSGDSAAAKYLGMNEQNWRDYIKEPKPVKKPSKYPSMNFGKYEWYVLKQHENGTLLLLSKYGIDTRPWNSDDKPVTWAESTLCNWLNSDFIKESFTQQEQQALVKFDDGTLVSLLNSDMIERYLKDDGALTVQPNQYALQHGAFSYTYRPGGPDYRIHAGNGLAWLKDTFQGRAAKCISWNGSLCEYPFSFEKAIVRPLIRMNRNRFK